MFGKKVLYLSYDGLSDPLGQSQIIPYLQGLSLRGFYIHIISFEKSERSSVKSRIAHQLNESCIIWHPLVYHKFPPVVSSIWDLFQLWGRVRKLHRRHNFNIIHCRSYIPSMVGILMKRAYNTKFIFDMRGFWADERVDGGLWNLKNPLYKGLYKFFKNLERDLLENADTVITLTNNAKNELLNRNNLDINVPVEVVPCCVDLLLFNNKKSIDDVKYYKEQLGITSEDFIITYLGAIGTWYMLDEMLDFFNVLKQTKSNAKFLFISAEKHSIIRSTAEIKGISRNSILTYSGTRIEIPVLISLSDVAIFFIKPTYSKIASSPTKQGELMAMGIPIICNSGVGDTDEIIKRYNAGTIVEEFDYNNYKSVVDNITNIAGLNKNSIIRGAHEIYSLERAVEKYSQVYSHLIN